MMLALLFLEPWALAWGALGGVIVLLYLLKLRRRAVPVSTLFFWEQLLQEQRRRAWLQKLRRPLSLLLQLLIFALVLLALARPLWSEGELPAQAAVVLVVDGRAHTQAAVAGGESHFAQAIAAATEVAAQAGAGREMAVIFAGPTAQVAVPFTADGELLRQRLRALQPTGAAGELAPALSLAESLLAGRTGEKRLFVFTDRPPGQLPSGAQLRSVGQPLDNVGLTQYAARPLPGSPDTCEVLAEVQNFGTVLAQRELRLTLDGKLLEVRSLTLAPGQEETVSFSARATGAASAERRGWLTAELVPSDALALDDRAFATLPTEPPVRVLLVSAGNWFLERVLAADPLLKFELLAPAQWKPELAAGFDAVIFDDFVPPGFDLEKAAGQLLFLGRTPFRTSEEPLQRPELTDLDENHPALRVLGLRNLAVVRAEKMTLPAAAHGWQLDTPARFLESPLAIAGRRSTPQGEQRLLALAWKTADSDLPLRVAFPLLISNAAQWLARGTVAAPAGWRAGEEYVPSSDETIATTPEGAANAARVSGPFRPPTPGFYALEKAGRRTWLPVNLASAEESNLRPANAAETTAPAPSAFAPVLRQPLAFWQWLALAALALSLLEWALFHRRRTE